MAEFDIPEYWEDKDAKVPRHISVHDPLCPFIYDKGHGKNNRNRKYVGIHNFYGYRDPDAHEHDDTAALFCKGCHRSPKLEDEEVVRPVQRKRGIHLATSQGDAKKGKTADMGVGAAAASLCTFGQGALQLVTTGHFGPLLLPIILPLCPRVASFLECLPLDI